MRKLPSINPQSSAIVCGSCRTNSHRKTLLKSSNPSPQSAFGKKGFVRHGENQNPQIVKSGFDILGQLNAVPIPGSTNAYYPALSPDGVWLLIVDALGNTLKRLPVAGGLAETITSFDDEIWGMDWGPDDTIVYSDLTSGGLLRVPVNLVA